MLSKSIISLVADSDNTYKEIVASLHNKEEIVLSHGELVDLVHFFSKEEIVLKLKKVNSSSFALSLVD